MGKHRRKVGRDYTAACRLRSSTERAFGARPRWVTRIAKSVSRMRLDERFEQRAERVVGPADHGGRRLERALGDERLDQWVHELVGSSRRTAAVAIFCAAVSSRFRLDWTPPSAV